MIHEQQKIKHIMKNNLFHDAWNIWDWQKIYNKVVFAIFSNSYRTIALHQWSKYIMKTRLISQKTWHLYRERSREYKSET